MKVRECTIDQLLALCRQNRLQCEGVVSGCPLCSLCHRIDFKNLEFFYGKELDEEVEVEECK